MNQKVKEMSFAELDIQILELKAQMEVLVSEMEARKEQAIANYRLHLAQIEEDVKLLNEMGIDPDDVSPEVKGPEDEHAQDVGEIVIETKEPAVIVNKDMTHDTTHEITVNPPAAGDGEQGEVVEPNEKRRCNRLLTPIFKLWESLSPRETNPVTKENKKETSERKRMCKLLTPFYKLYTDAPIKKILKIGNKKHRDCYPDPDETRVSSVDGLCPTLTATHSDLFFWIGPGPEVRGDTSLSTA